MCATKTKLGAARALVVGALIVGMSFSVEAAMQRPSSMHETVTPLINAPVANIPGKRLVSVIVEYPPGAKSLPHRHARSAFIYAYVLSGEIRSAVDDEPERIYRTGEGWIEKPGAHHVISENASNVQPARLLAVFLVDENEDQLTTPDAD
jgi:quercetin dioxygenase-like cupin family protein